MGAPFNDITLYAPTPHSSGTVEYWEEIALYNYISDLYIICMHGYKPPNTTRVTIEPSFYNSWDRTWKNGSLRTIAVYFNYDLYSSLSVQEKYKYVLDVIQEAMLCLSEEYKWDKTVFEKAYQEIIANNFKFKIDYPGKMSKDKKKIANISLEKTEMITTVNVSFAIAGQRSFVKLFDKKNWWVFDSAYVLVKGNKWFDNDRFGIFYKPMNWSVWYSLKDNQITFDKDGIQSNEMNMDKILRF